jgi:hypothetical protein
MSLWELPQQQWRGPGTGIAGSGRQLRSCGVGRRLERMARGGEAQAVFQQGGTHSAQLGATMEDSA